MRTGLFPLVLLPSWGVLPCCSFKGPPLSAALLRGRPRHDHVGRALAVGAQHLLQLV